MNTFTSLRRSLDRLTLYLPLILFAFLALGSWWLVRSVPDLLQPQIDAPIRQDPDYRLTQFTVKSFDAQGRMTREISGQSATHFPATQALHIEEIRVFFENEVGTRLNAQAKQGVSLEAEDKIILIGDARAVRAADDLGPLTSLASESLTAMVVEERLSSSLPVQINRAENVFTGQSMNFDVRSGLYELKGQVKSTIAPARPG